MAPPVNQIVVRPMEMCIRDSYDPWWNVAAENQASDRAHRIGQDKQVTVFKLIMQDTIEERIRKLQENKAHLADELVGGQGMALSELTREDYMELLRV